VQTLLLGGQPHMPFTNGLVGFNAARSWGIKQVHEMLQVRQLPAPAGEHLP
jgi:hypothetical protein